jgi:hypothetical protein
MYIEKKAWGDISSFHLGEKYENRKEIKREL